MPDLAAKLNETARRLREAGVAVPEREAALLVALAVGRDRAFLIAHPEYQLTDHEAERLLEFTSRRAAREPFQHIAGKQEFWRLDFIVTPDVMIPRPETEMIVEAALGFLRSAPAAAAPPRVCDVGTGSGCIVISILDEIRQATAVGLDISEKALRIAGRNADRHQVADRLELRKSDVFSAVGPDERFDLIVSNPPYVPLADVRSLQTEVRDFDPPIALTDGGDGLSIIGRIVRRAPDHLRAGGRLLVEIGFNQQPRAARLFRPEIWERVEFLPDLQGIPRMIRAQLKNETNTG